MVCIGVSFFVMIVSVAVSSGFRNEIRRGISSVSGDIQLIPSHQDYVSEASPIGRNASYVPSILALDGVESVSPVIYRTGIIKKGENIHGVMFKGVEEAIDTSALAVSIPRKLSEMLELGEGDPLVSYFVGDRVKVRKFHVAKVHESVLSEDNRLVVYASLSDMQRLNGWDEDGVSAFEICVKPSYRSDRRLREIEQAAGFLASSLVAEDETPVYAVSSVNSNPQLFDWLNLIDFNVLFILMLMTIVAGFNMISGLLIMLFENIPTIGLLKAVGMDDRSIGKVFLLTSSSFVLKGMVAGNVVAGLFCLLQGTLRLIPLNPENYFISYVPVHINPLSVLAADALAYVVIMALLMIPTLFISKVDPAETVRMG